MLFIVDGTGPYANDSYAMEMAGSFCGQLRCLAGVHQQRYWRGPSITGIEVPFIARDVARAIRERQGEMRSEPVFLCGYSRGGLAVGMAAQYVFPRPIEAMFLFDAVDRAPVSYGGVISSNVRRVYHARRNPAFANRFEADVRSRRADLGRANQQLNESRGESPVWSALFGGDRRAEANARAAIDRHAKARNSDYSLKDHTRNMGGLHWSNFGNTSTRAGVEQGICAVQPPGAYQEAFFNGSHGALGGVPWPEHEVPGDAAAAAEVRRWMWERIRKEGAIPGRVIR